MSTYEVGSGEDIPDEGYDGDTPNDLLPDHYSVENLDGRFMTWTYREGIWTDQEGCRFPESAVGIFKSHELVKGPYRTEFRLRKPAMPRSKDKVKFHLPASTYAKGPKVYDVLTKESFGVRIQPDTIVKCRPAQFARFLIWRNEEIQTGNLRDCTTFSAMKPELVQEDGERIVDVSENSDRV